MIVLVALVATLIILFYTLCIRPLYYWDARKVPNKRGWPILGKQARIFFRRIAVMDWIKEMYHEFPNKRYSGTSQLNRPVLLVRDPDLIKQITIKDFDHFVNRINIITKELDPLVGNSLLFQQNDEWRAMRSTLSPAYTSSKMKAMFELMLECADQFADFFYEKGVSTTAINTKEVVTRFTNDVIASCAFGVKCDSLRDKNNEFYSMGKVVGNFGGPRILKIFTYSNFPWITKIINLPLFSTKVNNFFRNIVKETLEYREKTNIVRPDMLHLLLEAKRGKLQYEKSPVKDAGFAALEETDFKRPKLVNIDNEDITAQSLLFFLGGFEPVSTAICFLCHELAVNPDIQGKLRREIDATYKEYHGSYTYEGILGMKYLDMVVSETLRKWPAVPIINRMCTKDYTIKAANKDELDLQMKKGSCLIVPTIGLHHDEKYYANPQVFNPERFNDKNKVNITPYTYMPFGMGPRSCIGTRFALLEMKTFIATLLTSFEIVAIEKTPVPLKLKKGHITMIPEEGFWVGFKPRKREVTPYY